MKNLIIKNFPLLLIILLGLILRLLVLWKYGNFWDDEMFSFIFSQKTWTASLQLWLWETNPPLHLLILKLWFYLLPATEFIARFLSLIFGVSALPLIYSLGKNWHSKNVGLWAAFFLALHPYHLVWSATARAYSLLIFLTLLAVYFFYQIFFQNASSKKMHWGLALANFLLLMTHLSAMLVIFCQILLLKKQNFKLWWQINFLPLAAGAAWISCSFILKMHQHLEKSWWFNLHFNLETALSPLSNLFIGLCPTLLALILLTPLILFLLWFIGKKIKQRDSNFAALAVFACLPPVFALLSGLWHIKFFLVSLPFWILIISAATQEMIKYKKIITAFICLLYLGGLALLFSVLPLSNWRPLENYLQKNFRPENSQVFVYNNYVLKPQIERYLNIPQPVLGFVINPEPTWEEWAVKNNYLYLPPAPVAVETWAQKNNLFSYREIFLLQAAYAQMPALHKLLEKNYYQLLAPTQRAPILGRYYFYHYVKN